MISYIILDMISCIKMRSAQRRRSQPAFIMITIMKLVSVSRDDSLAQYKLSIFFWLIWSRKSRAFLISRTRRSVACIPSINRDTVIQAAITNASSKSKRRDVALHQSTPVLPLRDAANDYLNWKHCIGWTFVPVLSEWFFLTAFLNSAGPPGCSEPVGAG